MPKAIDLPRLALYTFVDCLLFQYDNYIHMDDCMKIET